MSESFLDDPHEEVVGVDRLLAALQEKAVGRGNGQSRHLRKSICLGNQNKMKMSDIRKKVRSFWTSFKWVFNKR